MRTGNSAVISIIAMFFVASVNAAAAAQGDLEKLSDGIILPIAGGHLLKVQACAPGVLRIAVADDRAFFSHKSLSVIDQPPPQWTLTQRDGLAIVSTGDVTAEVDTATGDITFHDAAGKVLLAEAARGHTLEKADVQGQPTRHVRQQWNPEPGESLYGLGQNQLGLVDLAGYDLDLWQHNGTIALPFLISSRGWGILWDNTSYTRFGDLGEFEPIPPDCLLDASSKPGTIDLSARGRGVTRWEGTVVAPASGDYQFQTFSNFDMKVWIDGNLVIDHWRQNWLPWLDVARVNMQAGSKHAMKLEWTRDQTGGTAKISWKKPHPPALSLWSHVGDGIDYYFINGPKLDQVIAGYRRLTGQAPMMPEWAFGLWQSRQRYQTAQQSLDVVKGFRSRDIPFDNIVQDWQYWKLDAWGSHQFDPARFPDPIGWVKAIHDLHAHLMISVWGKFYPGNANFSAMHDAGYLFERNLKEGTHDWLNQPYTFFDAFSPGARKMFWQQIDRDLFSKGIDAWWMDASEPDLRPTPTLDGQTDYMNPTALGPGSRVLNAYPLMTSQSLYDGQREKSPDQRVMILTRSAFLGQQRYAAAVWSGDSSSTWTAMRKQIQAGLSFSISGMPYWTMDVGGFSVPPRFSARNPKPADLDEWREMNARWFEFGTFCPLLRVHGEAPNREMWELGGDNSTAYQGELKFDRLRYQLYPYIYSLAGDVTQHAGTMMRPLVMDFPNDAAARSLTDEYMFGPAFLVCPVTIYQARSREVLLPSGNDWYDYWSGKRLAGGTTMQADAPYDAIPIFVRAGAIVPIGPVMQYIGEKPEDPVELRIYPGADGDFSIYEDGGLNYNYERGEFSRIALHWNDAARELTIAPRSGEFPGMLRNRTFNVSVTGGRPQTVSYHGDELKVRLEK